MKRTGGRTPREAPLRKDPAREEGEPNHAGAVERLMPILLFVPALVAPAANPVRAADPETAIRERAGEALRRGVEFFHKEVAGEGAFLWQYSEDLSKREGEGKAPPSRAWVQPPGTPSVGDAFLAAHEATGEGYYLEVARETAHKLARGQLRSGGWYYWIDFDREGRKRLAYREGGKEKARNVTTLDDDTTQAAVRFLAKADRALGFRDAKVHEAVRFALESLLEAQYPNGAWPQGYDRFPEPDKFPVKKASYPETWSRAFPGGEYRRFYTLNDDLLLDLIETFLEVSRIYGEPAGDAGLPLLAARCRAAAERAGGFLLLAQMPEPQPAWAQQYDFEMHPAWARKFEPPAISGGESQGAMRALLLLYRATGDGKYLEPIPRAIDYLRRSRLPGGRLARFYEMRTNRPLYFTKDYRLAGDDADVPTHYSFKVSDGTESIARECERLRRLAPDDPKRMLRPDEPRADRVLLDEVKRVIAAQDGRGRWVEDGRLRYHGPGDPTTRVIRCDTFIRNVEVLTRFLAARR